MPKERITMNNPARSLSSHPTPGSVLPAPPKFADAGRTDLDDLVDLNRYPVHLPQSARMAQLIADIQAALHIRGCARLPGFLTPAGLERVRRASRELSAGAYFHKRLCNIYNTDPDPDLPESDPRQIFFERSSGFVTRDMIPADKSLLRIYVSPGMKQFVAASMGLHEVFEYADPFAGLVVNVMPPGGRQPWHYDTNEFITTIMTDEPEAGGEFEYCPHIRRPGDENLDNVGKILRGEETDHVHRLQLRAGDLQLFKGRYSLHQVTSVRGPRTRLTAILGYTGKPGLVGPMSRTRQLYGRVAEAHILADRARDMADDGLIR
jgi:hypothetical protein